LTAKAVYEKDVPQPLQPPKEARARIRAEIYGMLRGWRVDPQKLKDELRGIHG